MREVCIKEIFRRVLSYFLPSDKKQRRHREQIEDALKIMYNAECYGHPIDITGLCMVAQIPEQRFSDLLDCMVLEGLLSPKDYCLTEKGKQQALHIIRRHRLYETYLSQYSGYNAKEWHILAEEHEHKLSPQDTDRLNRILGNPLFDPHGDPIPREGSLIVPTKEVVDINGIKEGDWLIISHLEDDDQAKYLAVVSLGLQRGVTFYVKKINTLYWEIFVEGDTKKLRRDLICAIDVRYAREEEIQRHGDLGVSKLSNLKDDEVAIIHTISATCRGMARRRLMDLGFVCGSSVIVDVHSPMGNPTAYLVRGSAIALRKDQADYILIKNIRKQSA